MEVFRAPEAVIRPAYTVFEGTGSTETAEGYLKKFNAALEARSDCTSIWPTLAQCVLLDPDNGVMRFASSDQQAMITRVAELYRDGCNNKDICESTKSEVQAAAEKVGQDSNAPPSAYAIGAAAYAAIAARYEIEKRQAAEAQAKAWAVIKQSFKTRTPITDAQNEANDAASGDYGQADQEQGRAARQCGFNVATACAVAAQANAGAIQKDREDAYAAGYKQACLWMSNKILELLGAGAS